MKNKLESKPESTVSNIIIPDYTNTLTNLASSIQKYFGIQPTHTTLTSVDEVLNQNKYQNIVVLMLDGLGTVNIMKNLPETSFLRRHFKSSMTSVMSSSTVPATTAFRTGLNPNETGLLGWTVYDTNISAINTPFRPTDDLQSPESYGEEWLHSFHSWFDDIPTFEISKFSKQSEFRAEDLVSMFRKASKALTPCYKKFIFIYFDATDTFFHKNGWDSDAARDYLKQIDYDISKWSRTLNQDETKLIITADHGHAMVDKRIQLEKCSQFYGTLKVAPTIESRAATFFIKDGMQAHAYNILDQILNTRTIEPQFILMTRQEVLQSHIFGIGKNQPRFESQIGDITAFSKGKMLVEFSYDKERKGSHGSFTEEEMLIPLIMY